MNPLHLAILSCHPDKLSLTDIAYLRDPQNAAFLLRYEAVWDAIIGPRRMR